MNEYLLLCFAVCCGILLLGAGYWYLTDTLKNKDKFINELNKKLSDADAQIRCAINLVEELDSKYTKLFHEKKSSEVRVGKIGENLAPFLEGWPYDPNTFRFLGNPIDGIQFSEDKIRFIEIKTGKAKLSGGQRLIRDLILKGKISFVSFRVGEDGCSLTEEDFKPE